MRSIGSRTARALVRCWSERLPLSSESWPELTAELDRWKRGQAKFWWRDDDTIEHTAQLGRLLDLSDQFAVPLALAVIPAMTGLTLPALLRNRPDVCVLAHGWSHQNHALLGRPEAELASGRVAQDVYRELSAGRYRLEQLFGEQFRPVQVPPHNAVAPGLVRTVARAGFAYISIDRDFTGLKMPSRNIHVDVIDWRNRRVRDTQQVVRQALSALRLRRCGLVDPAMPIGLLTHHLVHDAETWAVTELLLHHLTDHPAVSFPKPKEIFPV